MTEKNGERMLVFAPHFDDAEFGLGGYLHRVMDAGKTAVRVVVLATGGYTRSDGRRVTAEEREWEGRCALERLGVWNRCFRRAFFENTGATANYTGVVDVITEQMQAYAPTEVFIPLPSFNQDHRLVYNAAITATRPGAPYQPDRIWAYGYPGSCWGTEMPQHGKCYLRLSPEDLEAKIDALRMHKSQFEGRSGGVSPDAAKAQSLLFGAECGAHAADVVYLLREIF